MRQAGKLHLVLHLAFGLACLAVVALSYVILIRPSQEQIANDEWRTEQLAGLIKESLKTRREFFAARSRLDDLNRRIAATKARLPHDADESDFMKAVSEAADRHDLKIIDFRRENVRKIATVFRTDLSIKCTGDYQALCGFLHDLEVIDLVAEFRTIQISTADGQSQYPIEIRLGLYHGLDDPAEETDA